MADHKNSFSEDSSTQINEEKMQKSSDFEVDITRAGYLGSDPDKVKTINMTKLKAEITKVGLFHDFFVRINCKIVPEILVTGEGLPFEYFRIL